MGSQEMSAGAGRELGSPRLWGMGQPERNRSLWLGPQGLAHVPSVLSVTHEQAEAHGAQSLLLEQDQNKAPGQRGGSH